MEVRSVYKSARVSPKKARDVAREIQGLPVSDALDTLTFTPRKAAFLIGKTLKSAIANAENNHELDAEKLVVKEANVSDGPTFRRFKPRARGSASAIRKRTSHILVILSDEIALPEKPERKKSSKPAKAKAAPQEEQVAEAEEAPETEEVVEETAAADETPVEEAAPEAEAADESSASAEDEGAGDDEENKNA